MSAVVIESIFKCSTHTTVYCDCYKAKPNHVFACRDHTSYKAIAKFFINHHIQSFQAEDRSNPLYKYLLMSWDYNSNLISGRDISSHPDLIHDEFRDSNKNVVFERAGVKNQCVHIMIPGNHVHSVPCKCEFCQCKCKNKWNTQHVLSTSLSRADSVVLQAKLRDNMIVTRVGGSLVFELDEKSTVQIKNISTDCGVIDEEFYLDDGKTLLGKRTGVVGGEIKFKLEQERLTEEQQEDELVHVPLTRKRKQKADKPKKTKEKKKASKRKRKQD